MRVKGNTWAPDFEITFLYLICCVIIFAACGYAKLSLIKGGGGHRHYGVDFICAATKAITSAPSDVADMQTPLLSGARNLSHRLNPIPLEPWDLLYDIKHSFCMLQLLEQFAEQPATYVACQMQDALSQLLRSVGRILLLLFLPLSAMQWQWQPNSFRWH